MPRGHILRNLMDNEEVEVMYHCLANTKDIDFEQVARDLCLANASAAYVCHKIHRSDS